MVLRRYSFCAVIRLPSIWCNGSWRRWNRAAIAYWVFTCHKARPWALVSLWYSLFWCNKRFNRTDACPWSRWSFLSRWGFATSMDESARQHRWKITTHYIIASIFLDPWVTIRIRNPQSHFSRPLSSSTSLAGSCSLLFLFACLFVCLFVCLFMYLVIHWIGKTLNINISTFPFLHMGSIFFFFFFLFFFPSLSSFFPLHSFLTETTIQAWAGDDFLRVCCRWYE